VTGLGKCTAFIEWNGRNGGTANIFVIFPFDSDIDELLQLGVWKLIV
jgi:hypothetical protein